MGRIILLLVTAFLFSIQIQAQPFDNINAGIPFTQPTVSQWGDYDNDGDLDFLLRDIGVNKTKIFQNNNGTFTDINANLIANTDEAWVDYDLDGDLDLSISYQYSGIAILRNDNGTLVNINATFSYLSDIKMSWGDYDNDQDLDLLTVANNPNNNGTQLCQIYRNDNGTFTNSNVVLPGFYAPFAWVDFNNDGKLDIIANKVILKNEGNNIFSSSVSPVTPVDYGYFDFGDYDKDGDMDLLMQGKIDVYPINGPITKIYRNDNGTFVQSAITLQGQYNSNASFNDFDSDGDLDIILNGYDSGNYPEVVIYKNNGGNFTLTYVTDSQTYMVTGIWTGNGSFGDFDNDGDSDILLTGATLSGSYLAKILSNKTRSNIYAVNTIPSAPSNLNASVSGSDVIFSWTAGTDNQTPSAGLSYNLRVGTTPGGSELFSAMANATGVKSKTGLGNVSQQLSWKLKYLPAGTLYWSVQAVDGAYKGSAFSPEQTFDIVAPIPVPVPISPADKTSGVDVPNVLFKWTLSQGATSYQLQIAKDINFQNLFYDNSGITDTTNLVPNLVPETDYFWRIRGLNSASVSSWSSTFALRTSRYFSELKIIGMPELTRSSIAWGDFDGDKDLDFAVAGEIDFNIFITRIYRNNGGIFTDINAGLIPVHVACMKWADYDNDGDLDLFVSGVTTTQTTANWAVIYRNDQGTFTNINANILQAAYTDADFGDYDNDGDLDLLLAGGGAYDDYLKLYQYTPSGFKEAYLEPYVGYGSNNKVKDGSAKWGDFDNDGDLDVLFTGLTHLNNSFFSGIFKNNGDKTFTYFNPGLKSVFLSSLDWGDYDNDGDLDILGSGARDEFPDLPTTFIYRNNGGLGTFTNINASLTGIYSGRAEWGDFDNDGDLDILLSGGNTDTAKIYRNDNGIYNTTAISLDGIMGVNAEWGDYDNDDDLDILITGRMAFLRPSPGTKIFKNNGYVHNHAPAFPVTKFVNTYGNKAVLHWNKATDAETPQSGLTYNVAVYKKGENTFVISPMSDTISGLRFKPALGNSGESLSRTLDSVGTGIFYWTVQAVDQSFRGSAFSPIDSFSILIPPTLVSPLNKQSHLSSSVLFNWRPSLYATGYKFQISSDSLFNTLTFPESVLSDTMVIVSYLSSGTKYFWRVMATNNLGFSNWSTPWNLFTDSLTINYQNVIPLCPGSTIQIPYNVNTNYNSDNVFYAEISDASGNFVSADTIGSISSTNSGVIVAEIPPNLSIGTGYKLRTISSSPARTGVDNGLSLRSSSLPSAAILPSATDSLCPGEEINAVSELPSPYQWFKEGNPENFTDTAYTVYSSGTYSFKVTNADGCSNMAEKTIFIKAVPLINITSDKAPVVCQGDIVQLTINTNAPVSNWSTGSSNPTQIVNSSGKYIAQANNGTCLNSDTIEVFVYDCDLVWPGDADNNFSVDNYDLLPLGLFYNNIGTARDSISLFWAGNNAINWGQTQSNGKNLKFADCNGDGKIGSEDTLGIVLNFNRQTDILIKQQQLRLSSNNPELYFYTSSQAIQAGDTVVIEVWTGKSGNPVPALYGIAFDLSWDKDNVVPGSISITFEDNWLSSQGETILNLSKIFESQGKAYCAITKTNHIQKDGFGKIATLKFKSSSPMLSLSQLNLTIDHFKAGDQSGQEAPFEISNVINVVSDIRAGLSKNKISAYPNPFSELTKIECQLESSAKILIEVYDTKGCKVETLANDQQAGGQYEYYFSGEIPGVYFIKISIDDRIDFIKVVKLN